MLFIWNPEISCEIFSGEIERKKLNKRFDKICKTNKIQHLDLEKKCMFYNILPLTQFSLTIAIKKRNLNEALLYNLHERPLTIH